MVINDDRSSLRPLDGVGVRGEGGGPGDVAVAGGVECVAAFGEGPAGASVKFTQREEVGGDVGFGPGEAFLTTGKLVHQGEAQVLFFGGEIDFKEAGAELVGGFPTDLAAEAGLVAGGLEIAQVRQEIEENGLEELPVLSASGEEGTKPEFIAFGFVDVEGGEVTLAGSGDIEAQTELRVSS